MQHDHEQAPDRAGWRCGEFVIEPGSRRLLCRGEPIEVEERAFDLIVLLAARHDRAVDRREIIAALWGARPVGENTLRQVVYKARQALGDDGRRQAVIRTLHGRSLRWVAPLEPVDGISAATRTTTHARADIRPLLQRSVAVAAVLALALAAGAVARWRGVDSSPQPIRVAVVPLDNVTGDATLDWPARGLPGLMSGLLAGKGVVAVNPQLAARAWRTAPAGASSRLQQVRDATRADVVIDGRLRRFGAAAFELDLDLKAAQRSLDSIRITGAWPGRLAVDAVEQVRRELRSASLARDAAAAPAEAARPRPPAVESKVASAGA